MDLMILATSPLAVDVSSIERISAFMDPLASVRWHEGETKFSCGLERLGLTVISRTLSRVSAVRGLELVGELSFQAMARNLWGLCE